MIQLILLMCLAFNVHAATVATLLLKGSVPSLLSIEVTPEALASALPLQTTQADLKVAVVNTKSNRNAGYQVVISSANAGKLTHTVHSTSSITYTAKYGSAAVNLVSGQTFVFTDAPPVNVDRDFLISYTGVPHANLVEGDYTDTLTFTIQAN